jgi:hypothetical protein
VDELGQAQQEVEDHVSDSTKVDFRVLRETLIKFDGEHVPGDGKQPVEILVFEGGKLVRHEKRADTKEGGQSDGTD